MSALLRQVIRNLDDPDDRRRLVALALLVALLQSDDAERSEGYAPEDLLAATQKAAGLTCSATLRVRFALRPQRMMLPK